MPRSIPDHAALQMAIIMPNGEEINAVIDSRLYEMVPDAVHYIGREWKPRFEQCWENMGNQPFLFPYAILIASMPNGLTLETAVDALMLNRSVLGPTEMFYLETYEYMQRLWNGRDLKPSSEALEQVAKSLPSDLSDDEEGDTE